MSNELLNESLCYLIGAIDFANDQGKSWRSEIVNSCKKNGLKIKFLDPTNKITGLQKEVDEEHENISNLRQSQNWTKLSSFMKTIVREDHRSVDLSDFVIFYIDPSVHTCGSYFEFQSALTQKKPYFIICNGGKEKIPSWLYGICDHNFFFSSINEVVDAYVDFLTEEYGKSITIQKNELKEFASAKLERIYNNF